MARKLIRNFFKFVAPLPDTCNNKFLLVLMGACKEGHSVCRPGSEGTLLLVVGCGVSNTVIIKLELGLNLAKFEGKLAKL